MLSDELPSGPRQVAVARAEVEVVVAQEQMNLALDNGSWADATVALDRLREARAEVDRIMRAWIMDLPGAEDWAQGRESVGDAT